MALERLVTQSLFLDYFTDGKTPCNVRDFHKDFITDISTFDANDEPSFYLGYAVTLISKALNDNSPIQVTNPSVFTSVASGSSRSSDGDNNNLSNVPIGVSMAVQRYYSETVVELIRERRPIPNPHPHLREQAEAVVDAY